ncbi:hypothetical protein ACHAXR_000667 [Thalassiosira sp. AJA248-18]
MDLKTSTHREEPLSSHPNLPVLVVSGVWKSILAVIRTLVPGWCASSFATCLRKASKLSMASASRNKMAEM